jgi:hypothetical protein
MLMSFSGTEAFVVEGFAPDAPGPDVDKETKQQCPLCNVPKKLKEMRDHVGRHILLSSRGVEEHLVKPVSSTSVLDGIYSALTRTHLPDRQQPLWFLRR